MRWQLASTFAVMAMSGCYSADTVDCGDGYLCPAGKVCAEPGYCGDPLLVEQCFALSKPTYAECALGGASGVCLNGICSECLPDRAGCATPAWAPMTSPVGSIPLTEVWVARPGDNSPVAGAWAGGSTGTVITYDGEAWGSAEGFPMLTTNITAIWGSGASNVYVAAGSRLFNFDGAAWAEVMLPVGGDEIKAIDGTSATDIYAVGVSQTVYRYDGTSWRLLASSGPTLEAVVATGTGAVAVGVGGVVMETDGTTTQVTTPLPQPYTSEALTGVFMRGQVLTIVAESATTTAILERGMMQWEPVSPSDVPLPLYAGWNNIIVGDKGTILRHDGSGWVLEAATPGINTLYAVAGAGAEAFAVGQGGAIWRRTD